MTNAPLTTHEQTDLRLTVTSYLDQQVAKYLSEGKSHRQAHELALVDFQRVVLEVKAQARSEN